MKVEKRAVLLAALMLLALVCAPRAYAVAELDLTATGGFNVHVVDGGAGDANPVINAITYVGPVGPNWLINVSTVLSKDAAAPSLIDLNSVNTAGAGAGALTIQGSDNFFTPSSPGFTFQVGGTMTSGWDSAFSAYGGNSNAKFDLSNQIGSTLSFVASPYAGSTAGAFVSVDPYSLTIQAILDSNNIPGLASFDASIEPVPEPASVALLGGVLLLTTTALRRKFRRA